MQTTRGKIHNPDRARQLRDFSGLQFDNITPTDIDGLIEYKGLAYVIIELKYGEAEVPDGQRLALERLTDDLERSKKSALCIIASHEAPLEEEIDVANCLVTKYRQKGTWKTSLKPLLVKDIVKRFLTHPHSDVTPITHINLERLQSHWREALEQAPEDTKRTPVLAILRSPSTRPVAAESNTIVLAFNYQIHKELLEKAQNKEIAEKIISNFLGYPCRVRCVYDPNYGHLVKAALEMGAEIIDEE
jgi:hypothetical protein